MKKIQKDYLTLWKEVNAKGLIPLSYSAISVFNECKFKYKLQYIDKIKKFTPSVHLVFGNAMHTVIQKYLQSVFNKELTPLTLQHLFVDLHSELMIEYKKSVTDSNGKHFSNNAELIEFETQGRYILKYLLESTRSYFSPMTWELVDVEYPISEGIPELDDRIGFMSFLDIVLKNKQTGKYKILDLKTSTKKWTKYQFEDDNKINQLRLYKALFSHINSINLDDIDVEFLILVRTPDDGQFCQVHVPTSNKTTIVKLYENLKSAINYIYTEDKQVNKMNKFEVADTEYPCKFCPYSDKLCPKYNDISEFF